uniref:hypothetical protein n=1 Tax=Novosphingobium sp. TaxID=1874826 RepID=UPI00262DD5A6
LASDGPSPHPNIEALVGASTFGNPETGGFLFFGPNEDANVAAAAEDPIDESELDLDDPVLTDPAPAQTAPVSPAPSAIKPAIPYEDTPS